MAISDYRNGKVVATIPIGAGVDGAAFDPASGTVFASNGSGTLTAIHQDSPDRYHVVENVPTARGARTLGLDPANHRLFTVFAKFGQPAARAKGRRRLPIVPGSFTLMVIERAPAAR